MGLMDFYTKKEEEEDDNWVSTTIQKYVTIDQLDNITPFQWGILATGCTTSFIVGYRCGRWKSTTFTRFTSVHDIPSTYFQKTGGGGPTLRGRVVSVSDGDTVRFLHVPTIFHSSRIPRGEKISSMALPIRICTIDTPEISKFGKPGQPFGTDAKEKLQSLVDNRMVHVQLLQQDQYSRAVAQVSRRGGLFQLFRTLYMDEELLKHGLAEVYQGSGAVYGHKGKQAYLDMEQQAQKSKIGIWSQGNDRESAAAYKARTK